MKVVSSGDSSSFGSEESRGAEENVPNPDLLTTKVSRVQNLKQEAPSEGAGTIGSVVTPVQSTGKMNIPVLGQIPAPSKVVLPGNPLFNFFSVSKDAKALYQRVGGFAIALDKTQQHALLDWCTQAAEAKSEMPPIPPEGIEAPSDGLIGELKKIRDEKLAECLKTEIALPEVTPSKNPGRVASEMRAVAKIPVRLFQAYGSALTSESIEKARAKEAGQKKVEMQESLIAVAELYVSQHKARLASGFGPLTDNHLKRLSPDQIRVLIPEQLSLLEPHVLESWNMNQIQALSAQQLDALSPPQLQSLMQAIGKKPIESITSQELKGMSAAERTVLYALGAAYSKVVDDRDEHLRLTYQALVLLKLSFVSETELAEAVRPVDVYTSATATQKGKAPNYVVHFQTDLGRNEMQVVIGSAQFSFKSYLDEYLSLHPDGHKEDAKGPFVEKIKHSLIVFISQTNPSFQAGEIEKKAQTLMENILPFMYQVSAAGFWNVIEPKVNGIGEDVSIRGREPFFFAGQCEEKEGKPFPLRGKIEVSSSGVRGTFEADMKVSREKDTLVTIPMGVAYNFDPSILSGKHYSEAPASSIIAQPYIGNAVRT